MNGLDMVGTIAGTAVYATMAGVLVGYAKARTGLRVRLFVAATGWLALIVVVGLLGGFAEGTTGPVPAPVLAFFGLLAFLVAAWNLVPAFRDGLLSLPLAGLVGLNAARLGGLAFVLLAAQGRLSAPFAPVAGIGDMVVGALAIPLAVAVWRRRDGSSVWLRVWNALGALDLAVAIALGALSAPGTPFRVFTGEPGMQAFARLPWVMVPAVLVPVYFLIHFTIAAKLRTSRRSVRSVVAVPA